MRFIRYTYRYAEAIIFADGKPVDSHHCDRATHTGAWLASRIFERTVPEWLWIAVDEKRAAIELRFKGGDEAIIRKAVEDCISMTVRVNVKAAELAS